MASRSLSKVECRLLKRDSLVSKPWIIGKVRGILGEDTCIYTIEVWKYHL